MIAVRVAETRTVAPATSVVQEMIGAIIEEETEIVRTIIRTKNQETNVLKRMKKRAERRINHRKILAPRTKIVAHAIITVIVAVMIAVEIITAITAEAMTRAGALHLHRQVIQKANERTLFPFFHSRPIPGLRAYFE
jgi:hypothetical protein